MAKNRSAESNNAAEIEHVDAEPVEEYHISASGKIEQTPQEKKRMYKESLIRTLVATLFGIACGIICYSYLGSAYHDIHAIPPESKISWVVVLFLIMVFTYYIQKRLVFPLLRINMKLLDWKSWFGIQFLVLVYCLVTWTILLN